MDLDIDFPDPFMELAKPTKKWRYYGYAGGRSSGKSTTVALLLLVKATVEPLRILAAREYQNSIADSVHRLMADLIAKYKLPNWEVGREYIRNQNGSEIFFKGLKQNAQSIRSLESIDICYVEEAASLSSESLEILLPTVRKSGSFFVFVWNPLTLHDAIWERIFKNPDERTYYRQVNSEEVENLLSDEIIAEREKMKKENYDLYLHIWEGHPLSATTGSIYGKQLEQARKDGRVTGVPYDGGAAAYVAMDLGIGDSTAMCFFQVVGKEIHFIDYYESCGEPLRHYIDVIANKPYDIRTIFLPHDAKARELQTGKTREEFFRDNGFSNVTILRPTRYNIGQDDINLVARPKFSMCWFDEKKCQRLLECLGAYAYDYDEKNKILRDKPRHDYASHAADAFMYALIAETEQVEVQANVNFKTFTPEVFTQEQQTGF